MLPVSTPAETRSVSGKICDDTASPENTHRRPLATNEGNYRQNANRVPVLFLPQRKDLKSMLAVWSPQSVSLINA